MCDVKDSSIFEFTKTSAAKKGILGGGFLEIVCSIVVGDKGLEPSTSRSQTARASQLRQSPRP